MSPEVETAIYIVGGLSIIGWVIRDGVRGETTMTDWNPTPPPWTSVRRLKRAEHPVRFWLLAGPVLLGGLVALAYGLLRLFR